MANRPDLPALTGLRFFAALSIAATHFGFATFYKPFGLHLELALIGMPLFFCLSGFIMHYVYSEAFSTAWRKAGGRFAFARFSRLYPLYIALIGYFVVFNPKFAALMGQPAIGFSYLTLTQTWWYWQVGGETIGAQPFGLSWSLSTEWFFYFVYAAVLYRVARVAAPAVLARLLVAACLAAFAVSFVVFLNAEDIEAFELGLMTNGLPGGLTNGNSVFAWLVWASPYFRIWEFVAGVLACQLYLALRDRPVGVQLSSRLFWWGFLWLVSAFLLVAAGERLRALLPQVAGYLSVVAPTFLMAPGMVLVLLGVALGRCMAARLLSISALVFGGEISYSLYLGHQFVGSVATLPADFPPTPGLVIQLFIACVIAAGMYSVIELPAKRFLRRFAGGWRSTGVAYPARRGA
jgi:peptidoglycan/LPS O-acetylase OafA/YrhL